MSLSYDTRIELLTGDTLSLHLDSAKLTRESKGLNKINKKNQNLKAAAPYKGKFITFLKCFHLKQQKSVL